MNDKNNQDHSPSSDTDKNTRHTNASAVAIAVTSGKGGVGKTNITTNLGIALAKSGAQVCIFDADTSLANINILLGLAPEHTLEHYINGELAIDEIVVEGPENLKIIPSATGIAEYANLDSDKQAKLAIALETLEQQYDYILIDTAAGIGETVINFIQSAQYAIVVISPEPTSLTDAFSLIKVLKRRNYAHPIYILVNMTNNYKHSMEIFKRFAHAVNKYVQLKVRYLGYIPMDSTVRDAIAAQLPIAVSHPDSPAGRCIYLLANILLKHFRSGNAPVRKISQFWREQYEKTSFAAPSDAGDIHTDEQAVDQPAEEKPPTTISETTRETVIDQAVESQAPLERAETRADSSTLDNINQDDLISSLITDQKISQEQTENLLTQLISYYLMHFETLPKPAIDLVLKAHARGEIPEDFLAHLQPQDINKKTKPHSGNISSIEKLFLKSSEVGEMYTKVHNLVSDAEHTKKELTDLAMHIRKKYRDLYNHNLAMIPSSVHPLRPVGKRGSTRPSSDKNTLQQSIYFASAVDQQKADK